VLDEESRIIGARSSSVVVRCVRCGLLSVDPLPTPEALADTYRRDDLPHAYEKAHGQAYVLGDREAPAYAHERLGDLERLLGGPGRLLDVGAARGVFLNLARSRGWDVTGIELSIEAMRAARGAFGLELIPSTVEEAGFRDGSFDAVHMSHVLEHLPSPVGTLREIHRILRPGGVLMIEVPNEFGDLMGAVRELVLRRRRPAYEVPSPHLYFFTPRTLRAVVRRAGFRTRALRTPRRARAEGSLIPLGDWVKRAVYAIEPWLRRGPLIELYALRP
jgi:SAM-dependent methyltransferase